MSDNISAVHLHDRACRGESLSVEERQQLDAWYIEQDAAEDALLNHSPATSQQSQLQQQIVGNRSRPG